MDLLSSIAPSYQQFRTRVAIGGIPVYKGVHLRVIKTSRNHLNKQGNNYRRNGAREANEMKKNDFDAIFSVCLIGGFRLEFWWKPITHVH